MDIQPPGEKMSAEIEIMQLENGVDLEPKPQLNGLSLHDELPRTPEEMKAERRFVLKIDLLILPLLTITFFLSSLDRTDISNAYTAGLQEELNMSGGQLSDVISFFFVGFVVFELPATLLLKRITANLQLGIALLVWGTCTTLLSKCNTWQQIAGVRIIIGAAEAFTQVSALYLTFFYKRNELATRGGIYLAMLTVAGSANGLLTYAFLENLNGVGGWLAWRWIFLVEGLMSVGFGFVVILLLPASPEGLQRFFSKQEKEIALRRYREAFNVENTKMSPRHILTTLKDLKVWFYIAIYMATMVSFSAFSNFLPVIIENFGYSPIATNLMTVPIWVSSGVFIVIAGVISDRIKKRGVVLLVSFAVAMVGWIILLASKSQWVEFVGTLFIGCGTLPQIVLTLAWMNSNVLGYTKRATALAIILILGQLIAIASAEVYSDVPLYVRGNSFSLGSMVVGFIITAVFMYYLSHLNATKLERQGSEAAAAMRSKTIEEVHDLHPDFFYYL